MIQKHSNIKFWILVIILYLSSAFNAIDAQQKDKNRLNIEFGTGLSSFKDTDGFSPYISSNIALSIWTASDDIYSIDAFVTGYYEYYSDISIYYGKMYLFKKEKKKFASIHGGTGYSYIHMDSRDIKTLGLTAQLKAGWVFDKGWLGFTIYQKITFMEGNNIFGVNLNYSLNLNKAIPK